jgi:hypothetical protein
MDYGILMGIGALLAMVVLSVVGPVVLLLKRPRKPKAGPLSRDRQHDDGAEQREQPAVEHVERVQPPQRRWPGVLLTFLGAVWGYLTFFVVRLGLEVAGVSLGGVRPWFDPLLPVLAGAAGAIAANMFWDRGAPLRQRLFNSVSFVFPFRNETTLGLLKKKRWLTPLIAAYLICIGALVWLLWSSMSYSAWGQCYESAADLLYLGDPSGSARGTSACGMLFDQRLGSVIARLSVVTLVTHYFAQLMFFKVIMNVIVLRGAKERPHP